MNRLFFLLTPLVAVAAFVSLFSKGKSKPPPRIARLALAVALYSALTAVAWFLCLKDDGYLIVEWKDLVLGPIFDLPGIVLSAGKTLFVLANLIISILLLLLPFWLLWIGVRRTAGKWLPYLLFGVLLFHVEGCCNAISGF